MCGVCLLPYTTRSDGPGGCGVLGARDRVLQLICCCSYSCSLVPLLGTRAGACVAMTDRREHCPLSLAMSVCLSLSCRSRTKWRRWRQRRRRRRRQRRRRRDSRSPSAPPREFDITGCGCTCAHSWTGARPSRLTMHHPVHVIQGGRKIDGPAATVFT